MRSRPVILFTALSVLTVGLFLLDLAVGAVRIPVGDVWAALTGGDCPRTTAKIVLNIRLIKAVVALLAGAALSVSGLQMQTLFRNPLAGPYVLGISSGASLGVALVVLAGVGRHRRSGLAGCGRRAARNRCRRTPHKGHYGDIDFGYDVLVRRERCRADIAISEQRGGVKGVRHLDDGVARRRDGAAARHPPSVGHRRVAAGRMDDQTAQPPALRRGICRNDGTEYPPFARSAVSLDDAAGRHGNGFLRPDRLHRSCHASRRADALPRGRPPRAPAGNPSLGGGGIASLRYRFQNVHFARKCHYRTAGNPDSRMGGFTQ